MQCGLRYKTVSLYFLFNLAMAELVGVVIMYSSFVGNWTPGYQFRYLTQFPLLESKLDASVKAITQNDKTCAANVAALTFNYLTTTLATLIITVDR